MSRSRFTLFHTLRVRWAEVDRQGIVFNAHYLTYFDVAITEYWRAIGYPYPQALLAIGADTFVVKATVEYHAPARYDDVLEIEVSVEELREKVIKLGFRVTNKNSEDLLALGHLVIVAADKQIGKAAKIPLDMFDKLRPFAKQIL